MLRPSRRGGVPVFRRPRQAKGRGFAGAAGRDLFFADVDEAAEESAGGQNHGATAELAPIDKFDAGYSAIG
jgi:hypothetical protein